MTMTYEEWRITFQDSEQAARAAFKARQQAQIQLEQYQARQKTSGLCLDAALRGESRSTEDYWDGRMDAVRELAAERNRLSQHAEQIADAVGFTADNKNRQNTSVITTNIENMKHFSECLHAIEQAFLMVPVDRDDEDYTVDDPADKCLVNSWGSTRDEYVLQFASAIAYIKAAGAAEALDRAMKGPGFSPTVVRVDLMQKIIGRMECNV